MIERVAVFLADELTKRHVVEEDKKDIYVFGFDIMLSTLMTWLVVLVIGLIIRNPLSAVVYLAVTSPLRRYGGGWHAPTHFLCTFVQCLSYLTVTVLVWILPASIFIWAVMISNFASLAFIIVKAPSEHPGNPLSSEGKGTAKRNCLLTECLFGFLSTLLFLLTKESWSVFVSIAALSATTTFLIPNATENTQEHTRR